MVGLVSAALSVAKGTRLQPVAADSFHWIAKENHSNIKRVQKANERIMLLGFIWISSILNELLFRHFNSGEMERTHAHFPVTCERCSPEWLTFSLS